ncbi:MAG: NAD(P)-dependent alcohol dehydrogenase [Gemmatimonadota bacterium]
MSTAAFAAFDATTPLKAHSIDRREPGPTDIAIEILYCGVCHSDLHLARSEWFPGAYPMVPGHEIVGRVTQIGMDVQNHKVGDMVGVGCLVDSCGECASCREQLENYCSGGFTMTYGSPDPISGGFTYGGYSKAIVVDEHFVLRVPENLDPAGAAPLLCAGITTYSPLKHWKVGPGSKVGVVGLGGLGHMAIQLAEAMGAEVTVFTTSKGKVDDAKELGATHVVISKDEDQMTAVAGTLDLIINTVAAAHDLDQYMNALTRDGTMVLVGVPPTPHTGPSVMPMVFGRKSVAGSLIGGLQETQEMLDFCGMHGITADIEMIRMDEINEAYERMLKGDVKYRFVIDMATM